EAREMTVALDEARHRELAVEIDHLSRGSDVRLYVGCRSHRDDRFVARCERLGFRFSVIERHDASVAKHEIGRRLPALIALPAGEERYGTKNPGGRREEPEADRPDVTYEHIESI